MSIMKVLCGIAVLSCEEILVKILSQRPLDAGEKSDMPEGNSDQLNTYHPLRPGRTTVADWAGT